MHPVALLSLFEFSLGAIACFGFLVIGGAVVILILIIRQASRSNFNRASMMRQTGLPPRRFQPPRIVEDGFWLHDPYFRPGSIVRYRYRTGGQTRTGTHRVETGPRGQFIYTGSQPDDVEILDVMPASLEEPDAVDDWDEPDSSGGAASSVPTA